MTVNEREVRLPEPSVAVSVTTVEPTGNTVPDGCELVIVAVEQLSVAVAAKVWAAPHWPAAALRVAEDGKVVKVGGVVSFTKTVTLKVFTEVLPVLSVAVTVTGVVPTGKKEPEAWL